MAARAGTDCSGQMIASCFYRKEKMTGNTERAAGRIVVGVDGTAASLIAVRWAAQEALLRQASVHLVFVSRHYERASYSGSPGVSPPGEDHADGRALLAAAELEAGRALPPGRLSAELADGSPAKVLIDRSADAELLVLGTAYPPGQPADEVPLIVGSTVRACLHGAACPVVVAATLGRSLNVSVCMTPRQHLVRPSGSRGPYLRGHTYTRRSSPVTRLSTRCAARQGGRDARRSTGALA